MPQRENPTRNKKKKKVPGKMRQKSGSWQAEVPSAMGQPLTQDFPQSIKQHRFARFPPTVPRAVGMRL